MRNFRYDRIRWYNVGGSFVFGSTRILAVSGVGYMLLKIDNENLL